MEMMIGSKLIESGNGRKWQKIDYEMRMKMI